MSKNVYKKGNLKRKTKHTSIKKKTTFVLDGPRLHFQNTKGIRKTLILKRCQIIDGGKNKTNFQIKTKDRVLELEASSVEDKKSWIEALKKGKNQRLHHTGKTSSKEFKVHAKSSKPNVRRTGSTGKLFTKKTSIPMTQHKTYAFGTAAPQLSNTVAKSLALFKQMDTDGDGVLTFKELRIAMCKNDEFIQDSDIRDVYQGLLDENGQITQKAFIQGLQMFYGGSSPRASQYSFSRKTSAQNTRSPNLSLHSSTQIKPLQVSRQRSRLDMRANTSSGWAANAVYKGLQKTKSTIIKISAPEEIEEEVEVDPEAKALAFALFQILDVSNRGIITVDELREGLNGVDPDMFSGEILDEVVEQLDETGTATVTEEEFTECFAILCSGTTAESMLEHIEMYKKKKAMHQKEEAKKFEIALSNFSDSVDDNETPEKFESSLELLHTRNQMLEQQLRQASLRAEKISRRYTVVRKEHKITKERSEQLVAEKQKLQEKEKQFVKWNESEDEYKKIADALERRVETMQKELEKNKQDLTTAKKRLNARRPSLIARLEKNLNEKDAQLQETARTVAKQKKIIQKAHKREKNTKKNMNRLKQEAAEASRLREEKRYLTEENKKLYLKAENAQRLLNEREIVEDLGCSPELIQRGLPSPNVMHMLSPNRMIGARSLGDMLFVDDEGDDGSGQLSEQDKQIEKLQTQVKDLSSKLETKMEELKNIKGEMKEKENELYNKEEELKKKEVQLKIKEQEIGELKQELKEQEEQEQRIREQIGCLGCCFWICGLLQGPTEPTIPPISEGSPSASITT